MDQFGGEACPEVIVDQVQSGRVTEDRIDQSVRRLLREKFRLGLFDNPYLNPDEAEEIVGHPTFKEAGKLAQQIDPQIDPWLDVEAFESQAAHDDVAQGNEMLRVYLAKGDGE